MDMFFKEDEEVEQEPSQPVEPVWEEAEVPHTVVIQALH